MGAALKLTTKSEYAILALIYLARNHKKGFIKIDRICSHYDIPKKYLEQIFTILKHNQYVKTRRGADGGYELAFSAGDICLAEIIRIMDGALAPTESVSKYFHSETPIGKEKKVVSVFKDIRDFISDKLEKVTLSDLV